MDSNGNLTQEKSTPEDAFKNLRSFTERSALKAAVNACGSAILRGDAKCIRRNVRLDAELF